MSKIAELLTRKPKLLLVLLVSLTLYFGFGLTKLEMSNNQDSELPDYDPIVKTMKELENKFGKKDIILIGIESDNIFNVSTLSKIKSIVKEVELIDGVIENQIFSIASSNNIVQSDWGLEIGPFLDEVPENNEQIEILKNELLTNKLTKGIIVSEDGTFTAIAANINEGYDESKVFDEVQAIVTKYENPEKIYIAGDPIQQQEIDRGVKNDLSFLVPLSILLVLIGLFISFKSFKGVVLPFSVIVLTIIWTLGFMGRVGLDMTVVSSLVPILMIVASSSYGIHIVHRYYEEILTKEKGEAIKNTIKGIAPAIIMTGITSAIAAASLLIFKVRSIREFGLITSVGMLIATFITLTLVPSVLAITKQKKYYRKKEGKHFLDKTLTSIGNFSLNRHTWVVAATIIILIVSCIGISKVKVGNDFSKYFPKGHRLRNTFSVFNEKLGGARTLDVVITGNDINAIKDPVILSKIIAFQDYAKSLDGVGSTFSIADIIKRMNKELKGGEEVYDKIPESKELVSEYLFLYAISGNPEDLEDFIDYDYQSAKIRMMLNTSEQEDHLRIYNKLKNYVVVNFDEGTKIEFGGDIMFWLAQIKYIVSGKIQNIILSIIFVLFFCMLIFRSASVGLYSIIPLTVSSLMTFGFMGFVGIRLDIATAVITAIGIGIGVDFAIHYISRFKKEMRLQGEIKQATMVTMKHTGKAIIFDVFSNIMGFVVFVFSGFMPIRYFGWLISLTMITMVLSSLFIFPAIFKIYNPYKKIIADNKSRHFKNKEEYLEPELVEVL